MAGTAGRSDREAARPLVLQGEHADGYVAIVRSLVAAAHLSSAFADPRRIDAHLALLGPTGSAGVHPRLSIEPRSGLPTLRQLLAVRADRDIAAKSAATARGEAIRYWREVAEAPLLEASSLVVRLRREEADGASLEVVHDRIDAASGCLVRLTALLAGVTSRHVEVRHPEAVPSPAFLNIFERHAGGDAELALLLLASLPGVRVEQVERGQVGPLHFRGLPGIADAIGEVIAELPSAFVLHVTLERSGAGVAKDGCRDPWGRLYRDTLGPEARATVEARRAALGYATFRERRLVTTPRAVVPLRAALRKRGAAILVRSP